MASTPTTSTMETPKTANLDPKNDQSPQKPSPSSTNPPTDPTTNSTTQNLTLIINSRDNTPTQTGINPKNQHNSPNSPQISPLTVLSPNSTIPTPFQLDSSQNFIPMHVPLFLPFKPHLRNAFATMVGSDFMYIVTSSTLILISTLYELGTKESITGKKSQFVKTPKVYVLTAEMTPRQDLLVKKTCISVPLPFGITDPIDPHQIHHIGNNPPQGLAPPLLTTYPSGNEGAQQITSPGVPGLTKPHQCLPKVTPHRSLHLDANKPDLIIPPSHYQVYIPQVNLRVYSQFPLNHSQWRNPLETVKINPPAFLMKPQHVSQHKMLSEKIQNNTQNSTQNHHHHDGSIDRASTLIWSEDLLCPPQHPVGNQIDAPPSTHGPNEGIKNFFSFQLPMLTIPTTTSSTNSTKNIPNEPQTPVNGMALGENTPVVGGNEHGNSVAGSLGQGSTTISIENNIGNNSLSGTPLHGAMTPAMSSLEQNSERIIPRQKIYEKTSFDDFCLDERPKLIQKSSDGITPSSTTVLPTPISISSNTTSTMTSTPSKPHASSLHSPSVTPMKSNQPPPPPPPPLPPPNPPNPPQSAQKEPKSEKKDFFSATWGAFAKTMQPITKAAPAATQPLAPQAVVVHRYLSSPNLATIKSWVFVFDWICGAINDHLSAYNLAARTRKRGELALYPPPLNFLDLVVPNEPLLNIYDFPMRVLHDVGFKNEENGRDVDNDGKGNKDNSFDKNDKIDKIDKIDNKNVIVDSIDNNNNNNTNHSRRRSVSVSSESKFDNEAVKKDENFPQNQQNKTDLKPSTRSISSQNSTRTPEMTTNDGGTDPSHSSLVPTSPTSSTTSPQKDHSNPATPIIITTELADTPTSSLTKPSDVSLIASSELNKITLYNNTGLSIALNRSVDYTTLFQPTMQIQYSALGETVPVFTDLINLERFLSETHNQLKLAQPITPPNGTPEDKRESIKESTVGIQSPEVKVEVPQPTVTAQPPPTQPPTPPPPPVQITPVAPQPEQTPSTTGNEINNWFRKTFAWGKSSTPAPPPETTQQPPQIEPSPDQSNVFVDNSVVKNVGGENGSEGGVIGGVVGGTPYNLNYEKMNQIMPKSAKPSTNYLTLNKYQTTPPYGHHPPDYPMNLMKNERLPLSLKEFYYLCLDNTAPLSMSAFHSSLPEQFFQVKSSEWSLCMNSISITTENDQKEIIDAPPVTPQYTTFPPQKQREDVIPFPTNTNGSVTRAIGHIIPPINIDLINHQKNGDKNGGDITPNYIWNKNTISSNFETIIAPPINPPVQINDTVNDFVNMCIKSTTGGYQNVWKQYLFRVITMKSKVSTPTGDVITRLYKTQRLAAYYALADGGGIEEGKSGEKSGEKSGKQLEIIGFELESSASTPDVKFGDSFIVVDTVMCFSSKVMKHCLDGNIEQKKQHQQQQQQQNQPNVVESDEILQLKRKFPFENYSYFDYPSIDLITRSNVKFLSTSWTMKPFVGIINSRSKSDNMAIVGQYYDFLKKNIPLLKNPNFDIFGEIKNTYIWPPLCHQSESVSIRVPSGVVSAVSGGVSLGQGQELGQVEGAIAQIENDDNIDNNDALLPNQDDILTSTLKSIPLIPPQLHPVLIIPVCLFVLPFLSLFSGNGFQIPQSVAIMLVLAVVIMQNVNMQQQLLTMKKDQAKLSEVLGKLENLIEKNNVKK